VSWIEDGVYSWLEIQLMVKGSKYLQQAEYPIRKAKWMNYYNLAHSKLNNRSAWNKAWNKWFCLLRFDYKILAWIHWKMHEIVWQIIQSVDQILNNCIQIILVGIRTLSNTLCTTLVEQSWAQKRSVELRHLYSWHHSVIRYTVGTDVRWRWCQILEW
jgi:hypothetical protein